MKTKILLLLLFGWAGVIFGQISKFKERHILFVYERDSDKKQNGNNKEDSLIYIYFVNNTNQKEEIISSNYDSHSNLISRTIKGGKVLDWSKKQVLTFKILEDNGVIVDQDDTKIKLKANIKAEKGRLYIYPWKFNGAKEDKINKFIKNNTFCIELKDNVNFAVNMHEWQAGVMTIPLKAYIGRRNKENTGGMVETGVGIGGYAGWKFLAKTHFVKLNHEEDYRVYVSGLSINGLLGLSAVQLADDNSNDNSVTFRGKFPALNTGIALGAHYKELGLLLSFGWDIPLNKYGSNWNFKGKPWVGIGLGYKLF
ncbi:hypothetical protein M2347_000690 [Chryseobacterium sp. H1D6B]|uniref:hypothetical protein n=1 Tax=Chryseobacterium sp. H1D6B TaxID=2940588 RepID=UPI0015CBDF57|nr:hypothetical protein [Chryseobacterium sp. H1D6B]MDH6250963.1 hypothetical protein [Chryseobacterium sp. H1D6B]